MQIKLDELIRATEGTHNVLLDLEELGEGDLHRIRQRYLEIAHQAREALKQGVRDTDHPEVELGEALARALVGKTLKG
jgi:low affinity Fe/Cu permease